MDILRFLGVYLCLRLAIAQTSTHVVTATTTLTASESGACNNFVGACVVYGTGAGAAPYTTTVYATAPSPTTAVVTATTTVYVSKGATASGAEACNSFSGACVVYATNGQGTYTSTVYSGHAGGNNNGNGDGVIGSGSGNSGGYIGSATRAHTLTAISTIGWVFFNLVFWLCT